MLCFVGDPGGARTRDPLIKSQNEGRREGTRGLLFNISATRGGVRYSFNRYNNCYSRPILTTKQGGGQPAFGGVC